MKWCRIQLDQGPAYGVVEGDQIAILSAAPFERHERTGERYPLAKARFLPPVIPLNFYAADLSERAFQRSDRTLWRAKNIDTFKPMGPVVVAGIDPMAQTIGVRINGRMVSEYETKNMIFSLAHYIARMTRYVTLYPGDVLWMGCDGPTLPALEHGDLVEVVNDAIGVLTNRVVRES